MTTLFVAVGGLIGVLGRWGISRLTLHSEALIWSTVGVNILASFLLGLLVAEDWFGGDMREGLGVGLLGGFSTFSTFSVQVVLEAEAGEAWTRHRLPGRLRGGRCSGCGRWLRTRTPPRIARRGRGRRFGREAALSIRASLLETHAGKTEGAASAAPS